MKNMIKNICRSLATAAVAGVLLSQVMIGEAMAQVNPSCSIYTDSKSCAASFGPGNTPCQWTNNYTCVPEMSDYLAMAFVVVAAGTVS